MGVNLKGTGVAVVTPFTPDGAIDYSALERIINHLIDNGINYIVSLGTTGESVTMTKAEKVEVVKHTAQFIDKRIPLVVGAGGNNTTVVQNEIEMFNQIDDISAYLSVSPAYNKPSQKGIIAHFKAVASATDRGIVLYNVPGRTSKNMDANTTLELAHGVDNVIAVKEAANNMVQSQYLAKHKPDDFYLISGDDDLILAQMAIGFDGVISVIANAFPKHWSDMIYLASQNSFDEARSINFALMDMVKYIFAENNPAGIKAAMKHLGICQDYLRLPLVNIESNLEEKIQSFIAAFNA